MFNQCCNSLFKGAIVTFLLDFSQSFGVLVRWPDDPQEKLLVFRLTGEETNKTEVVEQLAKMLASINFSTDHVSSSVTDLSLISNV